MALPVCQFVDRVGTGAVQRLNLNDGENFQLMQGPEARPGPDFSPPKLKRAVVNTLMVDGASIPASAYDNRIIRLPLRVRACDEETMAEILETLNRELDRGNNILKWHPTYNFRPVYFRTFRSPDYRLDQTMEGRAELIITLALVAEPFAYGDRVDSATITVNNDPAAVANPLYFDINDIEGDVLTPVLIQGLTLAITSDTNLLAIRRHGIPGGVYVEQAEAMVQGLNTAVQPNDVLMSGAGNNFSRTTFAAPAWNTRLTWTLFPGAGSSVDYRGTYRLFARLRKQVAGDAINVRVNAGTAPVALDAVATPAIVGPFLLDLGLLSIPPTGDPVQDGPTEVQIPVVNIEVRFDAERTAGAGYLDWDYVVAFPADEELALVNWGPGGVVAGGDERVFDGYNDVVFVTDAAGAIRDWYPSRVGALIRLAPNQVNRIAFHRSAGGAGDLIADTTDLIVSHWPRYLYIR